MADPYDITKIKRHPVVASFGADVVGPSEGPPEISIDPEYYESKIDENGGVVPVAKIVTNKLAKITIKTKNTDYALTAVNALDVGADVFAAASAKTLTLTPVSVSAEKVMTFTRAFLDASLSYTPTGGEDHVATLVFWGLPDLATGKLYTWETAGG